MIEDGCIPLLDVGILTESREDRITIRPDIAHLTLKGVTFTNQSDNSFVSLLLATGYISDLLHLLPGFHHLRDAEGRPLQCGQGTEPELFFVNYKTVPTRQLRQCWIEARAVARAIAGRD